MTTLSDLSRYGARSVVTAKAGAVPGPQPRKGPPSTTGGSSDRPCEARRSGSKATFKTKDNALNIMHWNAEGVNSKRAIYAPTTDYSDAEVEQFYEQIRQVTKQVKSTDILIIMGDLNAKVGNTPYPPTVGRFGLGKQNERGERLIQFCEEHQLIIANTHFKQTARKLYTWKSPGDVSRNQIDYIMISNRFKNNVKSVKTYPGADIHSDHNPVVAKLQIKLKVCNKPTKHSAKIDISALKMSTIQEQYLVTVKNKFESLMNITDSQEAVDKREVIENRWEALKTSMQEANEQIPRVEKNAKQKWMTEEILQLMKKRKQRKGTPEYAALNLLIRSECRKAKEKWLQDQCSKVESSSLHGRSKTMYDTLKEIRGTTRQNNSTGCIKDKEGNMLFEQDKIKARWVEYVGDLFDDARPEKPTMPNEEGPPIMREEVEYALRGIKDGKASGLDNITIEMLKALKEFGVDELTKLCNDIYDTGHLPNDMKESVFITLPKTPSATECGNFRTISLMSHTMKLLLKIILNRIGPKINKEVGHEQFGFRPNSGTREGIMCMKMVCEKYLEKHKDIYVCFIDYAKAFDRVHHTKLIECLKGIGIDGKDIRIIRNLYWEQTSCIRIGEEVTDQTSIQRGVRQGCVMSPSLFNLYTEIIFRNINELPGMNISGQNINNIRYADDTALVAETPEQLQALLDKVNEESENVDSR
ncbi:hypothetical protein EGW08_012012 [Elysia chlorotica]|uniref:Reverse transcriptase domain-containing protein n=1 Tax=Elysia chlorotica TaxID=188477 RepID=A0A3S1C192_ELYCH|nr:hypothetical protein EGW08_012012 [Elysia chlorotica]